jgi:hypothetical protein
MWAAINMDNTRGDSRIRWEHFLDTRSFFPMPIEDDADAIRALVWYYTDQK